MKALAYILTFCAGFAAAIGCILLAVEEYPRSYFCPQAEIIRVPSST